MTATPGDAPARLAPALAIAALALLAWWPLSTYWQSDDFLAVTYAHAPERALRDLAGNQYGTPALVWFYRPLITLAFALDTWLGGGEPFVSHLANALAHALSTLLVTLLGRRLLGPTEGVCAGLLWALWPSHFGSILWAVGRVDSHTTVWILATMGLTLRWLDTGRARWPWMALATFALALLSKELAFVTPGLVALLAFVRAAPGTRAATAIRATLPFALLFAAYLGWRWLVLGQLVGGYTAARFELQPALTGLGIWATRLVNPLSTSTAGEPWVALGYLAFPLAIAAALWRRRGRALLVLAIAAAICAAPTAPFWAELDELKNLRYFYLPAVGVLGAAALGGRTTTALLLAVAVWPWLETRTNYRRAHQQARALHASLRALDATAGAGAFLVAGLPRQNPRNDVLMFHLFVDRLLLAPFGSGRRVFALRPLVEREGVATLPLEQFAGLRDAHALRFDAAEQLQAIDAPPPLPDLAVRVAAQMPFDNAALLDLHEGRRHDALHFPGNRSRYYRITLLTGGGYLRVVLPNETPDAEHGTVSLARLLTARYAATGDDAVVLLGLTVPIAFDAEPRFPLVIEAGELQGDIGHDTFVASARAQHWCAIEFDREVARALGK